MSSVDAWMALAEQVAACPDHADRRALHDALLRLGLTDEARRDVASAVVGSQTPAAQLLSALAADATAASELVYDETRVASDDDLDRALAAATRLTDQGADAGVGPDELNALSPAAAADLVTSLVAASRYDLLDWVVPAIPPHRFPVGLLMRAAASEPASSPQRDVLVRAAALAPESRVLRGIAEAVADDQVTNVGSVVNDVAAARALVAGDAGPYRWWRHLGSAQPGDRAEPPATEPAAEASAPSWSGAETDDPVMRSPTDDARRAYARLDVASGTDRPDVVVIDQPFEVTVGLQPRRDTALVTSSPMSFAAGETVELDVVLLYDPSSITVTGSPRGTVAVSDADPHPVLTFTCVAQYGEELATQRRLGLQLLRDGQVVAVAWRTIVAVATAAEVVIAEVPPRREIDLLDLDPLLDDQPPDLVVSVCRADAHEDTFVWTAYAAAPGVAVPDLPSSGTLGAEVAGFALTTRRSIQFSTDPAKDYLNLAGQARPIGRAVPTGIRDAIRQLVQEPGREAAPAILLLTEELHVPWELAAFDPPLDSRWGAASPFLGAHAAIARWPLTEHRPRPRPRPSVSVTSGAVLTADYAGVPGWGKLDNAVAEAGEVAALFDPEAPLIAPELWNVIDLFRGSPASDVVHVALHGQFDAQGDQEGIVLLARSAAGGATPQFLSALDLENGRLDHGPFVFLNACQVGADKQVLGDYGGFASTLLRIGAAAVVAPLWNVRDDVAADVARQFYTATLTADEPVSVAEAVRAVRATYTEAAVRDRTPGLHATLVAYQVFGHPRLRLTRTHSTPVAPSG